MTEHFVGKGSGKGKGKGGKGQSYNYVIPNNWHPPALLHFPLFLVHPPSQKGHLQPTLIPALARQSVIMGYRSLNTHRLVPRREAGSVQRHFISNFFAENLRLC